MLLRDGRGLAQELEVERHLFDDPGAPHLDRDLAAALQETAVDLYAFVQAAGDAIIVADVHGRIVLWNPAAERLFGFTEAEAGGSSLDLIIPERFRERHWTGYRTVMETGQTRYGTQVLRVPGLVVDTDPDYPAETWRKLLFNAVAGLMVLTGRRHFRH